MNYVCFSLFSCKVTAFFPYTSFILEKKTIIFGKTKEKSTVVKRKPSLPDGTNNVVHISHTVTVEPLVDAIANLNGRSRVDEVSSTYFNGRSATHQKFQGILSRHNTTKTNNRNLDTMSYLIDHAESHWLHTGSRETTRANSKYTTTLLNIDSHTHQRINE